MDIAYLGDAFSINKKSFTKESNQEETDEYNYVALKSMSSLPPIREESEDQGKLQVDSELADDFSESSDEADLFRHHFSSWNTLMEGGVVRTI